VLFKRARSCFHPFIAFMVRVSLSLLTGLFVFLFCSELCRAQSFSSQECDDWYLRVRALIDDKNYSAANDTARLYIESCPGTNMVWHAFNELGTAVERMSKANDRWLQYRDWLKAVLYLDSKDVYYCEDALQILKSFSYQNESTGIDRNGKIAIIDYLLERGRCQYDTTALWRERNRLRKEQYDLWVQGDTLHTQFDTTKKTIDEIDLSILRGLDKVKSKLSSPEGFVLGSIHASSNPFSRETFLELDIRESGIVKFELLDLLGRVVEENPAELMETGLHKFHINGSNLANGTYHARFTTGWGEVKTVKLRHIK